MYQVLEAIIVINRVMKNWERSGNTRDRNKAGMILDPLIYKMYTVPKLVEDKQVEIENIEDVMEQHTIAKNEAKKQKDLEKLRKEKEARKDKSAKKSKKYEKSNAPRKLIRKNPRAITDASIFMK